MSVVHLVCLALSAMAAAATVAAGRRLRRTSGGVQMQSVGLITATALVLGNAVCVLPGTPLWYSLVLLTATAAGLGWLVTTLAAANGQAGQRSAGSLVVPGTLVAPAAARQPATVHELRPAPVRAASGPGLVTAQDLYDAGPAGSRAASSSTVYVATNLPAYVPPSPIERRNRALRTHTTRRDPVEALRRLRVAQAYNHTPARTSRVRHSL